MIAKGHVSYPWIGASIFPLIPEIANFLGLRVQRGAMIIQVVPNGPADRAGLKGGNRQVQVGNLLLIIGGDVLTKINREDIDSSDDLLEKIRDHRPGETIALTILRNGTFLEKNLVLDEKPIR